MTLRIGRIAYLNVAPYFHFLEATGFNGGVVCGVPAELNQMLAGGEIDACPSSSFEYGLHANDYLLLPGHSISSIGPVHSVLFFSHKGLGHLNGERIALTGESATSVNLLKIMLHEFCGVDKVCCEVPEQPVEDVLASGRDALLIGDRALRMAKQCPPSVQIIDLGALWYHFTGLPFVFALWILRRDAATAKEQEFLQFSKQLTEARRLAFDRLDLVADGVSANAILNKQELIRYWLAMSYDLTDGHQEGLRLYFTLCKKYGLLAEVPELRFLDITQA